MNVTATQNCYKKEQARTPPSSMPEKLEEKIEYIQKLLMSRIKKNKQECDYNLLINEITDTRIKKIVFKNKDFNNNQSQAIDIEESLKPMEYFDCKKENESLETILLEISKKNKFNNSDSMSSVNRFDR